MNNRVIIVCLIIFTLILTGCVAEGYEIEHTEKQIKTIYDINPIALTELSGTYVGHNVNVAKIISQLAAGGTTSYLSLKGEAIETHYILEHSDHSYNELHSYWFDNPLTVQQVFLNNAFYLTILVPNAKGFTFHLEDQVFKVSRADMEQLIQDHFHDFPTNDDLWQKEVVSKFIIDNQENIIALIESEETLTNFFRQHPIQTNIE